MPLAGEHYVIDVIMINEAQTSTCRLYYTKSAGSAVTQASLDSAANTVFTTLGLSIIPCIAEQAFLSQIRILLAGTADELESFSTVAPAAGSAPGPMMPEENAVVIQRRTGKPGRSKRGRTYWPFVAEEYADDSTLTTNGANAYRALANALEQTLVFATFSLSPLTPSFKNNSLTPVTQCRVLSEICSRRQRRSPKRPQYLT